MTKLFLMFLLLFACPPMIIAGQLPIPGFSALVSGASGACVSEQLSLLAKKNTTPERPESTLFRLGETLQIRLSGACAKQLDDELAKRSISEAVQLHLDNVAMAALPVTVLQGANPEERIVSFQLLRQPQQEDNRASWDKLLSKQHGSYEMHLPLALAIGRDLPVLVPSSPPFCFFVVTHKAALITNGICLLSFVGLYLLLIHSPSALRESHNGVYSLGKSQMAFWGLLVMFSFLGLWVLTGSMERIPEQVLVLLGISGATGLGSLLMTNSKLGDRTPRMSNSTIKNFLRDISDDGTGISLHRMQVVAWTLILGLVFFKSVNKVMSMPEFPETLLLLMGISNGLYLGFKFPEKVQTEPLPPSLNQPGV